jgi:methionyl aminopeptidase
MDNVHGMSIETEDELEGLRRAGRVVALVLRELRRRVQPGVSTGELDRLAGRVFARHGARSAPKLVYGAPCQVFISVGDEAVHGVPGRRRLRRGDLVKLDVTAELDGFYADACVSVCVGRPRRSRVRLAETAQRALAAGLRAARAGAPVNAIGAAVERTVTRRGHAVCRDLNGHGIGRRIHEPPTVPSVFAPELSAPLTEGLVLTVEPIVTTGSGAVYEAADGWTVRTRDGRPVAHAEHTIVVQAGAPLVLTA